MPNLVVTQANTPYSQDVKRFRINDCTLTATCPKCEKRVSITLDRDPNYLSYPSINVPFEFTFYHEYEFTNPETGEEDSESHEWSEMIQVRVVVEVVEPNLTE